MDQQIATVTSVKWNFFLPSQALTEELLSLNDELGNAYFENEYQELAQREQVHGQTVEDSLEISEADRNQTLFLLGHLSGDSSVSENETITLFQKRFSTLIFNHFSRFANLPHAKKGGTFSLKEELTDRMAEKLGFGARKKVSAEINDKIGSALLKLAKEFQSWLVEENNGQCVTSWGTIYTVGVPIPTPGVTPPYPVILTPDM